MAQSTFFLSLDHILYDLKSESNYFSHLTAFVLLSIMISMKRLNSQTRQLVIAALCEGNSLRSTSRLTGAAINTVVKLAVDAS